MKLTVIGSGNWQLFPGHSAPSFLVEHLGHRILLDCGYGTLARLISMGINVESLNAICVSHFHADHFGDLFAIAKMRQIIDGKKNGPSPPFFVIGPHGLRKRMEELGRIYNHSCPVSPKNMWEINWSYQWKERPFSDGPFTITPFPVHHVSGEMCLGYEVRPAGENRPDNRLVYSSDLSEPLDQQTWLAEKIPGCGLLVIEGGSHPSKHPSVCDSIAFARRFTDGRILVNHVPVSLLGQAKESTRDDALVCIAGDDMVFEI